MQHLWGDLPALDLFKINTNEGKRAIIERNIDLAFAVSGNLRNVIKTVLEDVRATVVW